MFDTLPLKRREMLPKVAGHQSLEWRAIGTGAATRPVPAGEETRARGGNGPPATSLYASNPSLRRVRSWLTMPQKDGATSTPPVEYTPVSWSWYKKIAWRPGF